jgi:hypothetical protein
MTVFQTLPEWVEEYFLPTFRRPLGGELRWCAWWWRHDEAETRLTALWYTWERARLDPGPGMAGWLRNHLDPQLPVLLGARGPFYQCGEDRHIDPPVAAIVAPWPAYVSPPEPSTDPGPAPDPGATPGSDPGATPGSGPGAGARQPRG